VGIGAPTLVEAGIVLSARLGRDARGLLARFLEEAGISVVPFTEAHHGTALGAWLKYGRGRHAAGLNFGDCLAYAVAKLAGMPLLCTGDDFRQTDLPLA
jgi:ribonuclease VapC